MYIFLLTLRDTSLILKKKYLSRKKQFISNLMKNINLSVRCSIYVHVFHLFEASFLINFIFNYTYIIYMCIMYARACIYLFNYLFYLKI